MITFGPCKCGKTAEQVSEEQGGFFNIVNQWERNQPMGRVMCNECCEKELKPRRRCDACDGKGYIEYEVAVQNPQPKLYLV